MNLTKKRNNKNTFRHLDVERVNETIDNLHARIEERFPNANLAKVCTELDNIVNEIKARTREITQPILSLRLFSSLLIILLAVFIVYFIAFPLIDLVTGLLSQHGMPEKTAYEPGDFLQGIEAVISGLFLLGLAIIFFITLEQRLKQRRILEAIHELRAIAHVVDMHQLTKDPSYIMYPDAFRTPSSPDRPLDDFELIRYLEYCSEMLAIIGKLAAYYAQNFNNPIVYDAVNDVENLTNDLSRKIWQKIAVLHKCRLP